ncbi:MAG: hypothetical protein WC312_02850 [Candidatus Omnitrophota bacterium]|jgi:hypothetical protein
MIKHFKENWLSWLICGFIISCALVNQYIYAVTDKVFMVDHDGQICASVVSDYNNGAEAYILSLAKKIVLRDNTNGDLSFAFTNFNLAVNFYIFGKTLFVYKMSMAWFLMILGLSVYFIVFHLTKKELFGLLASLMVLNLNIVINNSRTQFEFIPLAAICALAAYFIIKDTRLENKVNCLIFSLLTYAGVLIHPSAFFYFSFFYIYLLFTRKNKINYSAMLIFFLIIFAWNFSFLIPWVQAKYNNAETQYSFLGFLLKNIKAIHPREIYSTVAVFFGEKAAIFFAYSAAITAILHLIGKFLWDRGAKISPGMKFISLFFIYNVFFYGTSDNNINCFIMLFVLMVILFVLLLDVIWDIWPRFFNLAPRVYVVSVFLFVFNNNILSTPGSYFQVKPVRENPILFGKDPTAFTDLNNHLRLWADMADISDIIRYMVSKNKSGGKELKILTSGITLYGENDGIRTGRLYPVYSFWGAPDDSGVLYGIQAFYQDARVTWRAVPVYLYTEPPPWGAFASLAGAYYPEGPDNSLKKDLAGYDYMFFTVINQRAGEEAMWSMPAEGPIIENIKQVNRPLYDGFFADAKLFTKRRMHKNIFLYVFERPH